MEHAFDKDYWEHRWGGGAPEGAAVTGSGPPHPCLAVEVGHLAPGTALDAGCGGGAEASWLAARGWQVTAVDISAAALARAAGRAAAGTAPPVRWVEADLTDWSPGTSYDLVTTHYAHPAMPQLDFYQRVAGWVAPGGTLLVVGHLHTPDAHHGAGHPPEQASATAVGITARLDPARWTVHTAEERRRATPGDAGHEVYDVVVRATRGS